MSNPDDREERIHRLWDELADFDAARADESLDFLLAGLCELVDAQNACWFGTVRLSDILPGDPVHGWRPSRVHLLYPGKELVDMNKQHADNIERGETDITMVRNTELAGSFRANRLADLAPPEWFEGKYYRHAFLSIGHLDAIYVGIPLNEDAECYFGVNRNVGHARFTAEERDLVGHALRGLKWFCRQQMLNRGLMMASAPLTETEREVLEGLLTGLSEKQIAADIGRSYNTTHEYITNIYRKFGVNNRASLMSLWLGQPS